MKEEQVKISSKSIPTSPLSFTKKKKITPYPKPGSPSSGKPPSYSPPVSPPSSLYSSPYYSPPHAPVYSPPTYSAPDTFIKRIFNSINTIKYLPIIISLVIVAISLGRVLLYPLKLLVAGLILLLTKYLVFKIFNLSKYQLACLMGLQIFSNEFQRLLRTLLRTKMSKCQNLRRPSIL
jgi:hypothetical protein